MALKPCQTLHIINMDMVTDTAINTNITTDMAMVTVPMRNPKSSRGVVVFHK